jgi:uncharacterized protein (DUF433 family)
MSCRCQKANWGLLRWQKCGVESFQGMTADGNLRDNRSMAQVISRDPEIMHGMPVFLGTRVPVQTLFDYLEGGETLEDFLEGFPTVSRDSALGALEEAKQLLLSQT